VVIGLTAFSGLTTSLNTLIRRNSFATQRRISIFCFLARLIPLLVLMFASSDFSHSVTFSMVTFPHMKMFNWQTARAG
jgi:hypothetical protein